LAIDKVPAVTVTVPAFPGPDVLLTIVPLPVIDNVPAATVTWPASPVAAAKLFKAPSALLEIAPPLTIERAPASTVTVLAAPLLPRLACDKMPVADWGFPFESSMVSGPETTTVTLPALPEPKVLLEISPLLRMVKVPALTATFPAFPVLPCSAFEAIPVKP